jgi:hypothetical protein
LAPDNKEVAAKRRKLEDAGAKLQPDADKKVPCSILTGFKFLDDKCQEKPERKSTKFIKLYQTS